MRAIAELPKLVRRILVKRGARATHTPEGIDVWPIARFIRSVSDESLWP